MMRHSIFATCGILVASALMLSACDVTTPSQVRTGEIRLMERMKTVTVDPATIGVNQVRIITDDYHRNGSGEMSAVVSFMQGAKNELSAHANGARLKKAFEQEGIQNFRVNYVPVDNEAYAGQAIVTYNSTVAAAPANCGRIPGYEGADTLDNAQDYQIGCETKDLMSQMISRPDDLMGTDGTPRGDARRSGMMMEKYKSGTQNTKIDGENASTIGN